MTQQKLNKIFAKIKAGDKVDGWGGHERDDIDSIVHRTDNTHRLWARQHPNGQWVELPGLAENA